MGQKIFYKGKMVDADLLAQSGVDPTPFMHGGGANYQGNKAAGGTVKPYTTPSGNTVNGGASLAQPAKSPYADMPTYDVFKGDGLKDRFYQDKGQYNTGSAALNAIERRAFSQGPSAWANMANKGIDARTASAMDQAGRDASMASGSAWSQLAQQGGLDSGARERVATQGSLGRMNAMQAINRDANMGKLNVGMEDERQKLALMSSLPGMRMQQAGFQAGIDQSNINRDFGAFTNKYNEGMKAWGANKTANAMNNGGGGSIWDMLKF